MRSQDAVREEDVREGWTWKANDGELIDAKAYSVRASNQSLDVSVITAPPNLIRSESDSSRYDCRAGSSKPINRQRKLLKCKIKKNRGLQTTENQVLF
jgi:hypothetical protein